MSDTLDKYCLFLKQDYTPLSLKNKIKVTDHTKIKSAQDIKQYPAELSILVVDDNSDVVDVVSGRVGHVDHYPILLEHLKQQQVTVNEKVSTLQ